MDIQSIVAMLTGAAVGAVAMWALRRSREAELSSQVHVLQSDVAGLERDLDAERRLSEERAREAADKLRRAEELQVQLDKIVEAAAAKALRGNNEEFLSLAAQRLAPVSEKLGELDQYLRAVEKSRGEGLGSIHEHMRTIAQALDKHSTITERLTTALRKPHVRGKWGEVSLRNAVEAAGLTAYADFSEQVSVDGDDGRVRPDLVVNLPGGREIVVDAKVSLDAYLNAVQADHDDERDAFLAEHAASVRKHVRQLASKGYTDHFDRAPECVVMFMPLESMLSAALEREPTLLEEAARLRIVVASPATLVSILYSVAQIWRDADIAENAEKISAVGRELYQRLGKMGEKLAKVGRGLESAVKGYNETVGSLESRVFVSARKFEELGAVTGGLEAPKQVETTPRPLTAGAPVEDAPVRPLNGGVAIDDEDYGTLGRASEAGG